MTEATIGAGSASSTAPAVPLPALEYEGRRITNIIIIPIISHDVADIGTPGVVVELDPDVAEEMGAFPEITLSPDDEEGDDDGE